MQSIIVQGKVHFYQYMEVELLQEFIQKGINYFVNSLLNSTSKLVKLRYYSQQIGLLVNFIKDFYYLLKHKGTYAEYFFGMERDSLLAGSNKQHKLSKLKVALNAIVVTIVPYILNKVDSYYNTLKQEQQNQGKVFNTLQKLFTKIYPYLHLLFNLIQTFMKFRYLLFQSVKTYDLYYKCTNATLKEIEQEEEEGKVHYPCKELIKAPGLLSMLIGHKVLMWYFNNKNENKPSERKISQEFQHMSPLQSLQNGDFTKKQKKSSTKKGHCPICANPIQQPTVVKQTGHVYCYQCISSYVKQNTECPLTSIPLTQQNLQLIYNSS